jgi:hypothetical protein
LRLTPPGTYTVLYALNGTTDSSLPLGVIQASDGNLYGAAGTFRPGTVFKFQSSNSQSFEPGDAGLERTAVRLNAADECYEWKFCGDDFLIGSDRECARSSAAHAAGKKTIRGGAVSASDGWKSMEHVVCGRNFGFGDRVCGHTCGRDCGYAVVQSRCGRVPDWRRDSGDGWDAVRNGVGGWDCQGASVGERNGVHDYGSAAEALRERRSQ